MRLPGRRRGRIRGWGPRSRTWRRRRRRRPRRRGAPQRQRRQVLHLARARQQGRHPLDLHAPDPPEFNSKKRGEGKEERDGGLRVRRRTRRSSLPVRRRAAARTPSPRAAERTARTPPLLESCRSADGLIPGPLRCGLVPGPKRRGTAWNGLFSFRTGPKRTTIPGQTRFRTGPLCSGRNGGHSGPFLPNRTRLSGFETSGLDG